MNPYLIGGTALVIAVLAGIASTQFYRAQAAAERAQFAEQEQEHLERQVQQVRADLVRTNLTITARDNQLASLRESYESASETIRQAPDDTGCTDADMPDDIASVFVASPGQD